LGRKILPPSFEKGGEKRGRAINYEEERRSSSARGKGVTRGRRGGDSLLLKKRASSLWKTGREGVLEGREDPALEEFLSL